MPQFNSPLSFEKANRLIDVLNLSGDAVVLDAGCGEGEFLIRLIEATGANGVGIDVDPACIAVAICIGASHAFGEGRQAYPNAIEALTRFIRPGGQILIGECYWKQPPDPDYLKTIGDPVGVYNDHQENVTLPEASGLLPVYAAVSSEDEWDDFEWRHSMRIEQTATRNPDDHEAVTRAKENREWRNAYLQWGRATMGFGFYIFRKQLRTSLLRW